MKLDKLSHEENILAVGGTGLYFNAIVFQFQSIRVCPLFAKCTQHTIIIFSELAYTKFG